MNWNLYPLRCGEKDAFGLGPNEFKQWQYCSRLSIGSDPWFFPGSDKFEQAWTTWFWKNERATELGCNSNFHVCFNACMLFWRNHPKTRLNKKTITSLVGIGYVQNKENPRTDWFTWRDLVCPLRFDKFLSMQDFLIALSPLLDFVLIKFGQDY